MRILNLAIFIFSVLSSTQISGQVSQGSIRVGPNLLFSGSTQEFDGFADKFKRRTFELGITGSYFIIDNLEVGLTAGISSTQNESGSFESSQRAIFVGPLISYFIPLNENLFLPIGLGIGYNSITSEDSSNSDVTFSGIGYGIRSGIEYLVSNRLGARLYFGFDFGSVKDNDSTAEIDFSDTEVGIGFNFYFSK